MADHSQVNYKVVPLVPDNLESRGHPHRQPLLTATRNQAARGTNMPIGTKLIKLIRMKKMARRRRILVI